MTQLDRRFPRRFGVSPALVKVQTAVAQNPQGWTPALRKELAPYAHHQDVKDYLLTHPLTPYDTQAVLQKRVTQLQTLAQLQSFEPLQTINPRIKPAGSLSSQSTAFQNVSLPLAAKLFEKTCQRFKPQTTPNPVAYMILGLPNAGKTTLARDLSKQNHLFFMDGDDIRNHLGSFKKHRINSEVKALKDDIQKAILEKAVAKRLPLTLSFAPERMAQLEPYIDKLLQHHYRMRCILLDTSEDTCMGRIHQKEAKTGRFIDPYQPLILKKEPIKVFKDLSVKYATHPNWQFQTLSNEPLSIQKLRVFFKACSPSELEAFIFQQGKLLGAGTNGKVYQLPKPYQHLVAKVPHTEPFSLEGKKQKMHLSFEHEYRMLKALPEKLMSQEDMSHVALLSSGLGSVLILPKFNGLPADFNKNPFTSKTLKQALEHLAALDEANIFHGDPNLKNLCLTPQKAQWIDYGDTKLSSPWKVPHGYPVPPFFIPPQLGMSNLAMFQAKTLPFYWLQMNHEVPPHPKDLLKFYQTPAVQESLTTFLRHKLRLQSQALRRAPVLSSPQNEALLATKNDVHVFQQLWRKPRLKGFFYTLTFLKSMVAGMYLKARIALNIENNPDKALRLEGTAKAYAQVYAQEVEKLAQAIPLKTEVLKTYVSLERQYSQFLKTVSVTVS
jgi:predicted kinase